MRSALFNRMDVDDERNKGLSRSLSVFLGLSPDQQEACVDLLAEAVFAETGQLAESVVDKLRDRTQLTGTTAAQVLDMLRFFVEHMIDPHTAADTGEDWAEDLRDVGLLTSSQAETLVERLRAVRTTVLPQVRDEFVSRRAAAGVLPCFTGAGTTVELRAVVEGHYRWDTPVDDYVPKVVGVVPVVSVHLGLDVGTPKDVYFQMDLGDIRRLIGTLVGAEKDAEALRVFISGPSGREEQTDGS